MKTGSGDELWSAIADPSRRRVLDLLVHGGEPTASSLAHEVPFTRQAVTKHLAGLEDAGLITRHREAAKSSSASTRTGSTRRHRPWRSSPQWDRRLETIKRLAEAAHRNAKDPDERQ